MKKTIPIYRIKMLPNGVQMGHNWGIMLHFTCLSYGNTDGHLNCFQQGQMPHHSFYE